MDGAFIDKLPAFYVDWHLLNASNHICDYSHEPENILEERYDLSKVLEIAYRVLSLRAPEYLFYIYGGEPTIHPYFTELVKYLFTSGQNVRLKFETNGLAGPSYYYELLKTIPAGLTQVCLDVHLKYLDVAKVKELVETILGAGHLVHVDINITRQYENSAVKFDEFLRPYEDKLSYQIRLINGLCPENLSVLAQNAIESRGQYAEWESPEATTAYGYSVVGFSGMHIDTDGRMMGGMQPDDLPFSPGIIRDASFMRGVAAGPTFLNLEGAENCLARFLTLRLATELAGGPIRRPVEGESCESPEIVRIRHIMRRIPGNGNQVYAIKARPEIWQDSKRVIENIYKRIRDENSRYIFVQILKATLLGECSWADLEINSSISCIDISSMTTLKYPQRDSLQKLLAHGQLYNNGFVVVMPISGEWINFIEQIVMDDGNYDVMLQIAKDNIIAINLPPSYDCNMVEGDSLENIKGMLTIVVNSKMTIDELEVIVDDFYNACANNFEILMLATCHVDNITKSRVVLLSEKYCIDIKFIELQPLCKPWEIWLSGIKEAKGEYIAFLDNAFTLDIRVAFDILVKNPDLQCSIFNSKAKTVERIQGGQAIAKFATDGLPLVGGNIFKTEYVRKYGIISHKLAINLPEEFLIFAPIIQADNVLVLPGKTNSIMSGPNSDTCHLLKQICGCHTLFELCEAFCGIDIPNKQELLIRQLLNYGVIENVNQLAIDSHDGFDIRILESYPKIVAMLCDNLVDGTLFHASIYETCESAVVKIQGLSIELKIHFPLTIVVSVNDSKDLIWYDIAKYTECTSVEWVVVSNGTCNEILSTLEDMTSMLPNMRLYHAEKAVSQAQCYNVGLAEATGDCILFMKGSSRLLDSFDNNVISQTRNLDRDIFIFGMSHDGDIDRNIAVDSYTGKSIIDALFKMDIDINLSRFVYRRQFLIDNNLMFDMSVPSPDIYFSLQALLLSRPQLCLYMKLIASRGRIGNEVWISHAKPDPGLSMFILLEQIKDISPFVEHFALTYLINFFLPAYKELRNEYTFKGNIPDLFIKTLLRQYEQKITRVESDSWRCSRA